MVNQTTAATILQQLGGGRFVMMTGAKNLVNHGDALSFRMPRGTKDGSNYVKVTLTAMDDYIVETLSIRGTKVTPKSYREGVYCDSLQAVFTTITGFETSLGTMGGGR